MKNYLSNNNSKLKRDHIYTWGIPAYRSATGFVTCPFAGTCAIGCYAKQGTYTWSNVATAYETHLRLARSKEFIPTVDAEIKRRKVKVLRIHDSGDFFSPAYRDAWLEIIRRNPLTQFYAYTKAHPLFINVSLPCNFILIKSLGGKRDDMIDKKKDRHSAVFNSLKELKRAGYADVTQRDIRALGNNPKIGLVYHGAKGKAWSST